MWESSAAIYENHGDDVADVLNNLLTGVLGNHRVVLEDLEPSLPVQESVERIESAAKRATELLPAIREALPASPAVATDAMAEQTSRDGNETILVVDDEAVLRDSLAVVLELHGYTVLQASDGPEAIQQLRDHSEEIAVVFIEQQMRPMTGAEVLAELKSIDPDIKSIYISGFIARTQTSGDELGDADAILPKLHRWADFWRVIRHVLDADPV